jgi:hypothetical protein
MSAKITSKSMRALQVLRYTFALTSICASAFAQRSDPIRTLDPKIIRIAGTDALSRIEYVRMILEGTMIEIAGRKVSANPVREIAESAVTQNAASPSQAPQLTAQCTKTSTGKLLFELFANFGGVSDTSFYPPWRPVSSTDLFPPRLEKYKLTMEFLGYTRVKPVKREFEAVLQPMGQFRYNRPSGGSSNMEDSTYYLRFLLALPTLRLTLGPRAAEFLTPPLLEQIRREPICKASLL